MKSLINFISSMQEIANGSSITEEQVKKSYDQFQKKINDFANDTNNLLLILRTLYCFKIEFKNIKNKLKESIIASEYLSKASSVIDAEIEITQLRIRYPYLGQQVNEKLKGDLRLSSAYTKTDLIELITAIHLSGMFKRSDGSYADFNYLVSVFERLLNIKISNADRLKNAMLSRKIRLTALLDKLRSILIDKSQQ